LTHCFNKENFIGEKGKSQIFVIKIFSEKAKVVIKAKNGYNAGEN